MVDFLHRRRSAAQCRSVGQTARRSGTRAHRCFPWPRLKPLFIVRTPREFRRQFARWCGALLRRVLCCLPALALAQIAGRRGNPARAASAHRHRADPAGQHARSVARHARVQQIRLGRRGGLPRAAAAVVQQCSDGSDSPTWCYTPLFLAFGLFAVLLRFGTGPGGSDAKVNLGPFQPVEAIKILLVFFLAGYFARKWERLRDLRENRCSVLASKCRGCRTCFRCWSRSAARC